MAKQNFKYTYTSTVIYNGKVIKSTTYTNEYSNMANDLKTLIDKCNRTILKSHFMNVDNLKKEILNDYDKIMTKPIEDEKSIELHEELIKKMKKLNIIQDIDKTINHGELPIRNDYNEK